MKLLGLGDNVIDHYLNTGEQFPGGNAVNVAAHASLLGHTASYLGNLADDSFSQVIRDALDFAGVDYSHSPSIPCSSTKRCLYNIVQGERQFLDIDLGKNWAGPHCITEQDLHYMKKFDLIHSCCNAKMEDELYKLAPLPALFTYDFSVKEKYRTNSYLKKICTNLDLALFSCNHYTNDQILQFAKHIHSYGAKHILITCGSSGQYFYNGDSLLFHPAMLVKARDTMGAGDAFLSCFVVSLYALGWRKGTVISTEHAEQALSAAAQYAAENCLREGGFGYKVCEQ